MAVKQPGNGGARKGAGRKPGYRHPDYMRERIKVGVLLARAQRIITAPKLLLDPQEEAVRARYTQMLLNKALPDLVRTELTGSDGGPLEIITRAE